MLITASSLHRARWWWQQRSAVTQSTQSPLTSSPYRCFPLPHHRLVCGYILSRRCVCVESRREPKDTIRVNSSDSHRRMTTKSCLGEREREIERKCWLDHSCRGVGTEPNAPSPFPWAPPAPGGPPNPDAVTSSCFMVPLSMGQSLWIERCG